MLIDHLEKKLAKFPSPAFVKDYLHHAIKIAGEVPLGAPDPNKIQNVGVIGGGTMGQGIALLLLQTGRSVWLCDPYPEALKKAKDYIDAQISKTVKKSLLSEHEAHNLLSKIGYISEIEDLNNVELVVEAVPEVMSLKKNIIKRLAEHCSKETIIASNTSTLDIDAIAQDSGAPERVIGTHFFMPAHMNPLLEIVPAKTTGPDVLAMTLALAKNLGKKAVVAGNCDGFIGNRLFDRFHQEAMYLVEEGANPAEIDKALEGFGMVIGPFRCLDMIGNDIPWGVRKQRAKNDPNLLQPRIGDALCEAGLYGQKSQNGWFSYEPNIPTGSISTTTDEIIKTVQQNLGLKPRKIFSSEIISRCIVSVIIEGLKIVEEKYAQNISDIDMVQVTGYGFPAQKGGPMMFGASFGTDNILTLAHHYANQNIRSKPLWDVPSTIEDLGKHNYETV